MLLPDCKVPPDSCSLWFSLCETLTVYFGSHIRYLRNAGGDRMGQVWPTNGALWALREGRLCCLDLDLPLLVRWVLIWCPCQWHSWGICWIQFRFPRKYCDLIISWLKIVPWRGWHFWCFYNKFSVLSKLLFDHTSLLFFYFLQASEIIHNWKVKFTAFISFFIAPKAH